MRIGTVVEGPTDRLLLKAIIDKVCPGVHEYRDLQPADVGSSFGERGTGWKGVRRFCFDIWQQLNTDLFDFIKDYEFDLLVIHVDADIVSETDLQEALNYPIEPCPPVTPTIASLREILAQWLNLKSASEFPPQLILAMPSQDSENWLFAGLYPDDNLCRQAGYECIYSLNSRQHPAYLLTLEAYGRVLQRKEGKLKKSNRKYEDVLPELILAWDEVCLICSQAQAFNDALQDNLKAQGSD